MIRQGEKFARLLRQLGSLIPLMVGRRWASLSVQRKLLRPADIRTTMSIYGDVVTDEMAQAQSEVAAMAL